MTGERPSLLEFFDESTRRQFMQTGAAALAGVGAAGSAGGSAASGRRRRDGEAAQGEQQESFDYPAIDFTVRQQPGKVVNWVLPGRRRLDRFTFGTPEVPHMTPDHWINVAPKPVAETMREVPAITAGVPEDKRAVNEDGTAYTKTTMPTAHSDKFETVRGEFELVYKDRQPVDGKGVPPGETRDDVELDASFTDPAGNEYEVAIDHVVQPPFPGFATAGGVTLNRYLHGHTGTGTPLQPLQLNYGAMWGVGSVAINGEVVSDHRVIHAMSGEMVRDSNYDLAVTPELPLSKDEAYLGREHHTHLFVLPIVGTEQGPKYEPVPTAFPLPNCDVEKKQPFIHIMYDQDEYVDLTVDR